VKSFDFGASSDFVYISDKNQLFDISINDISAQSEISERSYNTSDWGNCFSRCVAKYHIENGVC